MSVTAEVMTVTPEMASQMLESMGANRPLRKTKIRVFAREMKTGSWSLNGEAIKFNERGELMDGQNRLWACKESGVSFDTLVVRDVNKEAFITMDSGSVRSTADHLAMYGAVSRSSLASALAIVWMYQNGLRNQLEGGPSYSLIKKADLVDLYLNTRETDWHHAVRAGGRTSHLVAKGVATACHYLFQGASLAKADYFFQALALGEGLYEGDPLYTLRRRFERNKIEPTRLRKGDTVKLIIKAWNAVESNKKLARIDTRGPIPEILGLKTKDEMNGVN